MQSWPHGHRCAVTVSFDFDAEELWIGENPANAYSPGVLSQGAYGPKVGIPLILSILDEFGISATFFVCGRDAQRHPDSVRSIVAAGHEIAHHGDSHTSPTKLTQTQEREELEAGLTTLRGLGAEVAGYRSPSWDFSPHTLDLLQSAGLSYSSNLLDDIVPYVHTDHDLVEIPVSWILDDAPHFWFANDTWEKTMRSPKEVLDVWLPEIDGISALGGHVMLTMHPMLTGRPSRLAFLRTILEHVVAGGGWIATAGQVADHVRRGGPVPLRTVDGVRA